MNYDPILELLKSRVLCDDDQPRPFENDFDAPAAPAARPSLPAALSVIADAFRADPRAFGHQLLATIGGWEAIEHLKPRPPITPMPTAGIKAIEISIGDRGPAKAGTRRDRQPHRYQAKIQVFTDDARSLSKPSWVGYAQLRTADRLAADLPDLASSKRVTPFSADYVEWLEPIIEAARQNDLLIGCLFATENGGRTHHDRQVVLVPAEAVKGPCQRGVAVMSADVSMTLPATVATDAKGRALRGDFVAQTRATRGDPYPGWSMGQIE